MRIKVTSRERVPDVVYKDDSCNHSTFTQSMDKHLERFSKEMRDLNEEGKTA